MDTPRPSTGLRQNHGGVADYVSPGVTHRPLLLGFTPSTFESLAFIASGSTSIILFLLIYRPGSQPVTTLFFDELTSALEMLVIYSCQLIIAGDINIHVEDTSDPHTISLMNILLSFDLIQHISVPTHVSEGTLDLVITHQDQMLTDVCVDPPDIISDHSLVVWKLPLNRRRPIYIHHRFRDWRRVNRTLFRAALLDSALCRPPPDATSTELFDIYHRELSLLADNFARCIH